MRERLARTILLGVLGFLGTPEAGWCWPTYLPGTAGDVAVSGDVFVGGAADTQVGATQHPGGAVTRLAADGGGIVWRTTVSPDHRVVAIDVAGGAVAAVTQFPFEFTDNDFTVALLQASDGAILWTHTFPDSGNGYDVVIDGSGDVIAAGQLGGVMNGNHLAVAKLAAADGAELWRHVVDGPGTSSPDTVTERATRVAMHPSGDVIFGGTIVGSSTGSDWWVGRLDGDDGSVVWEVTLAEADADVVADVIVDAAGDVYVTGRIDPVFGSTPDGAIRKLDGDTGAMLWTRPTAPGYAGQLAFHPSGDVIAAGPTQGQLEPQIMRLGAATGTAAWTSLPSPAPTPSWARVAVAPDGRVFLGSFVNSPLGGVGLLVAVFDGDTGAVDWMTDASSAMSTTGVLGVGLLAGGDVVLGATGSVLDASRKFVQSESFVTRLDGATGALVGCGDGQRDPGELCDDGNAAAGDGCVGCRLETTAIKCRSAIGQGVEKLLEQYVSRVADCRKAINSGSLPIDPADCPTTPPTATRLASDAVKVRKKIVARCNAATVASFDLCASTIDGLVSATGDSGCLVTEVSASGASIIDAAYGRVLGASEGDERTCQATIGTATYKFAKALGGAARKCADKAGKADVATAVLRTASCRAPEGSTGTSQKAGDQATKSIHARCADALLTSIAPCGLTQTALIDSDAGCVPDSVRPAIDRVLTAGYGY